MAERPPIPPRKKIALDNRKLVLSAPCPTAQGKFSTLSWGLVNNNPRLVVYTNDPADATERNDNGRISANLDAPNFFAFLEMLREVLAAPGPLRLKMENKNYIFPGGKRSEKPVVVSELLVGKGDDGVVWICVAAYDKERPKIKFQLLPVEFHQLYHQTGEKFSPGEASKLYATGYIRMLEGMMVNLLCTEWVEPPPREPRGGGNNRGGGRGGYGGGGGRSNGGGGSYDGDSGNGGSGDSLDDLF